MDALKIDKSFIAGRGEEAVNDAIVRLIVDFAHTLGLKVIAEGMENDRQVASLIGQEVRSGPGFYFSKPLWALRQREVRGDQSCIGSV